MVDVEGAKPSEAPTAVADSTEEIGGATKGVGCAWRDEDYLSLVFEPAPNDDDDAEEDVDSTLKDGLYDDLDQSSSDEAEASYDWDPRLPPPWLERGLNDRQESQIHPLTALHNEIVSFVHLMEPLPSEIDQREKLVDRIRATVKQHFDDSTRVEVFGSQATGLFLPTSDIDLVVITSDFADKLKEKAVSEKTKSNPETKKTKNEKRKEKRQKKKAKKNGGKESVDEDEDDDEDNVGDDEETYDVSPAQKSPLQRFVLAFQEDWLGELSYLEAVENTRIPLVKFTHAETKISVDVSFNQPTGPPAAQLMKRYLEALPPLRPLTFVLKYFLAARGLNEPYSGGVGSFMLQLMIVSFLQHRERDAVNFHRPSVYNLGSLLLEFFELYGMEFNYLTTGISVRHDGFFFPKGASDRRASFWKPDRMAMMALENPLDPTLDVGQSSFRYQIVQRAFAVAYKMLLAYVTAAPNEQQLRDVPSILATILPPTHYMTTRLVLKRRDRPLAAKRMYEPSAESSSGVGGNNGGKRQRWR